VIFSVDGQELVTCGTSEGWRILYQYLFLRNLSFERVPTGHGCSMETTSQRLLRVDSTNERSKVRVVN
jgi:hypothetical protein